MARRRSISATSPAAASTDIWEWKLRPWDTAAGTLIVREAGGSVSDFRGGAFDLFGEQTLASNGRLHAAMIRVLAKRLDRARAAGT